MTVSRFAVALVALAATACDVTLHFDGDSGFDEVGSSCPDGGCDAGSTCELDTCTCPGPTTFCSGSCFNLKSDHNHCGGCAHACANGEHCASGACVVGKGKQIDP